MKKKLSFCSFYYCIQFLSLLPTLLHTSGQARIWRLQYKDTDYFSSSSFARFFCLRSKSFFPSSLAELLALFLRNTACSCTSTSHGTSSLTSMGIKFTINPCSELYLSQHFVTQPVLEQTKLIRLFLIAVFLQSGPTAPTFKGVVSITKQH